jgi:hypothetical protein
MKEIETIPASMVPFSFGRPLCHPRRDQWGEAESIDKYGNVTVRWTYPDRTNGQNTPRITRPYEWFRIAASFAPKGDA